MPTVVDSLILELGLDPAKFTQGQREAMDALRKMQQQLEAGGKEVDAAGQKIGNLFSGLKREALTLGAAFFGGRGAKEFVQYITTVDASAGRLSKTLNVSTRELSAWQGVAVQTGGSVQGISGTLQGLTDKISTFALTGQTDMLPYLNALGIGLQKSNGQWKTATELLLDVNKSVQGMDPARARAMMTALGIDDATINALLMTNTQLQSMLANQKNLSEITEQDAKAAQELATAWHEAEAAATQLGRVITTWLSPALVTFLHRWRDIFSELGKGYIVSPDSWLGKLLNLAPIPKDDKPQGAQPSPVAKIGDAIAARALSPLPDKPTREAYIREAARKRGIDPDVAVAVVKSEGFNSYVGDRGSSFGDFQLHYGGVAGGGMAVGGLGDKFTKQTGLDARDPSTWKQQADFSLDEAKKNGWGPWHGWKGAARAGLDAGPNMVGAGGQQGSAQNITSNTTHIDRIVVQTATQNDAEVIARDIGAAIDRMGTAGSANYGQR